MFLCNDAYAKKLPLGGGEGEKETMTNGYMVYLLRILAAQGALASVYTDPEDPEGFSAGFVEAVDGQHVLMCDLSPWGQIDGLSLIHI